MRVVSILSAFVAVSSAFAQSTERVSVSTASTQSDGPSEAPSISGDGRYVVFQSDAQNLVAADTNTVKDVFVRDRQSGTLERISVGAAGAQGNFSSFSSPSYCISSNGRFVAFTTFASNLAPGTSTIQAHVLVRDRQSGTTELVSTNPAGTQGNGTSSFPSMSSDGRFVAFQSMASDLVAGDTNGLDDVFVRERQTGTTVRASVDSSGAQGDSGSFNPSISADGRFVAFMSDATNLVSGDTNGNYDIFVRDLQTGITQRVSVDSGGVEANDNNGAPVISGNGRFVAFHSFATNLFAGDTNGLTDVLVHDRATGTTDVASLDDTGLASGEGRLPAISWDGRYVAFTSGSPMVTADANAADDVFVRDRQGATTVRVSISTAGAEGDFTSDFPSITTDGRFVAFRGLSTNLVPGDTNNAEDIFVRDQGPGFGAVSFCSGDGTATACPCGNPGAAGQGCANSAFASGGRLAGVGLASVAADFFTLTGSDMPSSSVLYFQGTTKTNNGLGAPFGDGLRCASGSVIRLATKLNAAGGSTYPQAGDPRISIRGAIPAAGGTRTYQAWYRNAAGFCTPSTFNLTNGIQVDWQP